MACLSIASKTTFYSQHKGNLRSSKALESIARAHKATIYQIALAWVTSHPRIITIPMSFNPQHIQENFEAADIELTEAEFKTLSGL